MYLSQDLGKIAISKLCDPAGYGGGSPTNLIHHFDTGYPGHQDALGTAVTTGRGAETKMTAYGTHRKWPAWKDTFIRLIVMADQAPTVSFKEARYW